MKELSQRVKELLDKADEKDKFFLGRRQSVNQIKKSIDNLEAYRVNKTLKGARVPMVDTYVDENGVLGYNHFIVMRNAKATANERKYADMGNGLNYIYLKQIFVDPDFRGQSIGYDLVRDTIKLSEELGKHLAMDVHKNNYKMIDTLANHGFEYDYPWKDQKGNQMIRFFRE